MSELSNAGPRFYSLTPIPSPALLILVGLFFTGLAFSVFILVVIHNAIFFVSHLLLSAMVVAFLLWNTLSSRSNRAILFFLHSFPNSDLRFARHGQLVKISGLVSCGSVSLESSYEKADRCIYTSTLLYECKGFDLKTLNVSISCFRWRLAYCERFSTDFYIADRKSGVRAMVKAGSDAKVIPLINESRIVNTTRNCKALSSHLRKWLGEKNISTEPRLLRLEEGYMKEGSSVTVIGMLHRNSDSLMIVEPPELISTGCLWQKLLLPVDIDGLILGVT